MGKNLVQKVNGNKASYELARIGKTTLPSSAVMYVVRRSIFKGRKPLNYKAKLKTNVPQWVIAFMLLMSMGSSTMIDSRHT